MCQCMLYRFHAPFFRKDAVIGNGVVTITGDAKNIIMKPHDQRDRHIKMVETDKVPLVVPTDNVLDDENEEDDEQE